jgi:hypothetical protein
LCLPHLKNKGKEKRKMPNQVLKDRQLKRKMVSVTAEIIAQAIPKTSGHCMIADAVKAAYPEMNRVAVDLQSIRMTDTIKKERIIAWTPQSVQGALLDFDEGIIPQPFSFEVRKAQIIKCSDKPTKPRPKRDAKAGVGTNAVPIKEGGYPPPMAALAGGATGRKRKDPRVGQRRAFGLRVFKR